MSPCKLALRRAILSLACKLTLRRAIFKSDNSCFVFQIMGKYNPEEAAEVMGWIGDTLPDSGITANGDWEYVHQKLMDGYELCR